MKKFLKIIVMAGLCIGAACGRPSRPMDDESLGNQPEQPLRAEEISYQMVVDSVLGSKCLNCHSPAGGNKGGLNLVSYQNTFENIELIREVIVDGSMPRKPTPALSATQKEFILKWIDAGAREFAQAPEEPPLVEPPVVVTPPPVVEPVPIAESLTFANILEKVIAPKCLKCHSPDSDLPLTNFKAVFENREMVQATIEDGSMPRGKNKLTVDEKKLILDWLNAGSPEGDI